MTLTPVHPSADSGAPSLPALIEASADLIAMLISAAMETDDEEVPAALTN